MAKIKKHYEFRRETIIDGLTDEQTIKLRDAIDDIPNSHCMTKVTRTNTNQNKLIVYSAKIGGKKFESIVNGNRIVEERCFCKLEELLSEILKDES